MLLNWMLQFPLIIWEWLVAKIIEYSFKKINFRLNIGPERKMILDFQKIPLILNSKRTQIYMNFARFIQTIIPFYIVFFRSNKFLDRSQLVQMADYSQFLHQIIKFTFSICKVEK